MLSKTLDSRVRAHPMRPGQDPVTRVVVKVTDACDANCVRCYEADATHTGPVHLPVDALRAMLAAVRGRTVVLAGMEPTLHPELPQLVQVAAAHNHVVLATNGRRLGRPGLASALARAGLTAVLLNLDALSERTLRQTSGGVRLDQKLAALDRATEAGLRVSLSATLVPGLNDDREALRQLAGLARSRYPGVIELRLRASTPVGRHLIHPPMTMDDLLAGLCDALGLDEQDVLSEIALRDTYYRDLGAAHLLPRRCSLNFHLLPSEDGWAPLGRWTGRVGPVARAMRSRAGYALYSALTLGARSTVHHLGAKWKGMPAPGALGSLGRCLRVALRLWPTERGGEDQARCSTLYMADGQVNKFCTLNLERTEARQRGVVP